MKEAKIRLELHLVDDGAYEMTLLPTAPYMLSKLEKTMFIKTLRGLKTPSNYVGQLSKKITTDGEM